MNAKTKRRLKRTLVVLVAVYLIGGIALYFLQDKILFHPKPLSKEYTFSFDQPFEEINFPFRNNNLSMVRFTPLSHRKGIVLFYHGNMENVEHYKKYPAYFLRNNYEVWMMDYPGFGKTTGKRSEKIIDEQALLMYDLAVKKSAGDSIIIYGKSIGTGAAAYVASARGCRRLILETPYYSIRSLANDYFPFYPVNRMIRYSFPIHDYLKKLKSPIAIFHGTKDEVVPYKQSKQLKEENKNIELISIEKGKHNDLNSFRFFQTKLDSLLQH